MLKKFSTKIEIFRYKFYIYPCVHNPIVYRYDDPCLKLETIYSNSGKGVEFRVQQNNKFDLVCILIKIQFMFKDVTCMIFICRDFFKLNLLLRHKKVLARDASHVQNSSCRIWRSLMLW